MYTCIKSLLGLLSLSLSNKNSLEDNNEFIMLFLEE